MDLAQIAALTPAQLRAIVPGFINSYFRDDPAIATQAEERVRKALEASTDEEIRATLQAYAEAGQAYRPHEAALVLRRISRAYIPVPCGEAMPQGLEHLDAAAGRSQLWICNHLSYVDTQVTDALLARAGRAEADEMLVVAGPKVYTEPFRRLAAVALNTLMTAQSTQLSTNTAGLSPREVAAIAINSVKQAQQWRAERGPVLLYPEGSRSRSGRMGSFLKAAARYTRGVELIVPVAITGSEELFAFDERMRPATVSLSFGEPFEPPKGKFAGLEEAWARVGALLPEGYAPAPETAPLA